MEITIDTLISLVGLFVGGGGGAFFTWRYMRRKSRAEAAIEEQNYYQEMVEDIAKDRDYYKAERDEMRKRVDELTHAFMDWRLEADNDRAKMKMEIAKLGRKVETMVPFMCGNMKCNKRVRVVFSEDGTGAKPAADSAETIKNEENDENRR